jgi:hypothetical protein
MVHSPLPMKASERDGTVTVDIVVRPRAPRDDVGPIQGDRLRVSVTAPPVDGEANEAVVRTLAAALGLPRTAVAIVQGERGRRKTVRLRGTTIQAILAAARRDEA